MGPLSVKGLAGKRPSCTALKGLNGKKVWWPCRQAATIGHAAALLNGPIVLCYVMALWAISAKNEHNKRPREGSCTFISFTKQQLHFG